MYNLPKTGWLEGRVTLRMSKSKTRRKGKNEEERKREEEIKGERDLSDSNSTREKLSIHGDSFFALSSISWETKEEELRPLFKLKDLLSAPDQFFIEYV